MRITNLRIEDATGLLTSDGLTTTAEFRASSSPNAFTICTIAAQKLAVFVGLAPSSPIRARIARLGRPDWLAVLCARVGTTQRDRVAIEAEFMTSAEIEIAFAAFAVACAVFANGELDHEPAVYDVRLGTARFEVHRLSTPTRNHGLATHTRCTVSR